MPYIRSQSNAMNMSSITSSSSSSVRLAPRFVAGLLALSLPLALLLLP
jgi:hypothetical protein